MAKKRESKLTKAVRARLTQLYALRLAEAARREEFDKQYAKDLREVRQLCPHAETTYQSDPSGGSDSSTTCNLCGAEL